MFCTINDFKHLKQTKLIQQRLIGIDYGDRTLGISLSDITWTIATPYQGLKNTTSAAVFKELQQLFGKLSIAAVVIGYPLNMNGTAGPQSQKILDFCNKLIAIEDIPLLLWDERLSTIAVTRTMISADLSRRRQKQVVDKMAASFILQGVLDSL